MSSFLSSCKYIRSTMLPGKPFNLFRIMFDKTFITQLIKNRNVCTIPLCFINLLMFYYFLIKRANFRNYLTFTNYLTKLVNPVVLQSFVHCRFSSCLFMHFSGIFPLLVETRHCSKLLSMMTLRLPRR